MEAQNASTDEDEGPTYRLIQRDTSDRQHGSITVDSWDEAMDVVDSPFDHFDKILRGADVLRDFVGIKENRHENGRFDIMVESAGADGYITQHSSITVQEVVDE
jgi:hypothetical protein